MSAGGIFCLFSQRHLSHKGFHTSLTHARIQRGDRVSGPPLRFVRGGVLCGCLMGRRGGPKVVLSYYIVYYTFFWLALLVNIIKRVNV